MLTFISSFTWTCPPAWSGLLNTGVPQGPISWSSQPERSLPHGKLPILGCVHKIPGVPPVFTSIQLIININVLTARSKNIGYFKGSLESQHMSRMLWREKCIPNTSISVTILLLTPVSALVYFYLRSTYSRNHINFTVGTFFRLAKVPLKTVLSILKRTFICNEYVLYCAVRSTSIIVGDDY